MQLRFRSAESASPRLAQIATDDCVNAQEVMLKLYIDSVGAQITGIPEHLRVDICRELQQHLESLIAAHEELGDDREAATHAAIRQFGEPKAIASRFSQAWKSTGPGETTAAATRAALKAFCLGMAIYNLSLLIGVPYGLNLHGSVDAAIRSGWLWDGMWLIPTVTGAYFGWKFPRSAGRGAFYALSILTAVSAPFFAVALSCGNQPGSTLFTPAWYAWAYCTFLFPSFVAWLPVGAMSATAVNRFRTSGAYKASQA